jgi:ABC-2 type transport system ATP-binding protein
LTDNVLPVEVQGLVVEYDGVRAVDGLDLSVRAGDAVGLVGRNGAGKSTTMRVLAGLVPPSGGSVRVGGVDARKDPSAAKWYVGYCPDTGGLIPRATPWEHLQLAAAIRGMPRGWEARAKDLLDRFDLTDAADRVTAGFSHGMGRRTSVVLAAFHEPDVLLLDEPFDGVDPLGVEATMQIISEARLGGAAVLVSTHMLHLAAQATTEILVLTRGRLAAAQPADELAGEEGQLRYRALLS